MSLWIDYSVHDDDHDEEGHGAHQASSDTEEEEEKHSSGGEEQDSEKEDKDGGIQTKKGLISASFAVLVGLLVVLALCLGLTLPSHHSSGSGLPYQDSSLAVEKRVADLLSRMTLAEKIGQMSQIERLAIDTNRSVIGDYFIGSLLSGGGSSPGPNASPAQWAEMVDAYQRIAMSTRLGIPMIYGIDAVHGHNNVYSATIFPHNVGLGAAGDPDLVARLGAATAREVRATGIPYTFAPCIAVCRDPRWGRCYESYSEDPSLVRSMTSIIDGLQGGPPPRPGAPFVAKPKSVHVAACAKHFVGDGGTVRGVDESNTVSDANGLFDVHLAPYYDAIARGVSTIMVSYSSWNGVKMSANGDLVTDLLKRKMGFTGFAISDWEALQRITTPPGSNYTYSVQAAINAGIDMVMVPLLYDLFSTTLTDLVERGFISQDRIDDAVSRILRVKFVAGLFEHPYADRSLLGAVGSDEHRALAREAVRKSLVLLKNGKQPGSPPMLPLDKNAPRILVAGSHADDLGNQCGGWTISWRGQSGNNITIGTTILQGIKNTVSASTEVVYEMLPDAGFVASKGFSYAIVVVGEPPYVEMFGDSSDLTIPLDGINVINNVCGAVRCVVVLVSGRPLVVEPFVPQMDAFVAAWLPGTEGQGVADVLFGDHDFQGKLPRTWFRNVEQLPMNFGDPNYNPLYPYRYGLRMRQP